uniref:Uncharacterized protein n=1 Tax=Timema cristinae TaxID=61476 RepID=A0A7R9H7I8_TIMCR|nr:unnamed protein product [Timema cristinae]
MERLPNFGNKQRGFIALASRYGAQQTSASALALLCCAVTSADNVQNVLWRRRKVCRHWKNSVARDSSSPVSGIR